MSETFKSYRCHVTLSRVGSNTIPEHMHAFEGGQGSPRVSKGVTLFNDPSIRTGNVIRDGHQEPERTKKRDDRL